MHPLIPAGRLLRRLFAPTYQARALAAANHPLIEPLETCHVTFLLTQPHKKKKQASELAQANQVKSEFLSVMSHELRTPLNLIMGYAGVMQDQTLAQINQEQESSLNKIMRCSH
ncbi:MAG: hypothetical protein GTN65_12015, partial [Armatimonadetes bacterium]|nr:hypothetical protein [Armatimonadota bacterium]NIO97792.1 hypothetical protein [Armatimonadota bacterium]